MPPKLQIGTSKLSQINRLVTGKSVGAAGRLAALTLVLGARGDLDTVFEAVEDLDNRLWRQILIVVVIDSDHRGINTGTQALDLAESEKLVWSSLARMDTKMGLDGLHDAVRAAKLAGGSSARLDVVLAHRLLVVHGVESCDLVDTHRGHLQELCNVVHDGNRAEPELALAKIQQGHHGALFVLRRVLFKNVLCPLQVFRCKLESDRRVVLL